ncbi:precorrin-6x reductase [Thermosipho melanesiensis]|uniref:Precorrin-6x reductase n=2 Tax=Thermosipho melanesiensis TaxID=46541 RepID=A6LKW8_THEM4|nr:precorrin-6A reductase [Thermosipho melanesiensis]ABR30569.1 precorrin-6x reductase [Thermosipho melanesiensis BI429]APT73717.1 precorrin-6x reductase [Thermosipho melanesiensis]OOC35655.1 precorrin-6x reductase [Thermosipho melanesiensis]OOC38954.1 precorrin-6x reductase [Thermosipho melanesiensis]OOC39102.1 precorrin-6x reductase [Thermosipho melanesiensis]
MILVLSGTSMGNKIAKILSKEYNVIISSKTKYGVVENIKSIYGALNNRKLENLVKDNNVKIIIDATHDFAQEISKIAINVADALGIKYLRYTEKENIEKYEKIIYVNSHNEAQKICEKFKRIFFTIGSKNLHIYKELIKKKIVFVRILPILESIEICEKLNIPPKNIIAMQGPFSKNLNYILFKEKQVDVVVSKESNLNEKIKAVKMLNIPIIVIKKPNINYPNTIYSMDKLIQEVENEIKSSGIR